MQLGNTLRRLADLVDDIEATGVDVVEARPEEPGEDGVYTAELRVKVPAESDESDSAVQATNGAERRAKVGTSSGEGTAPETTDSPSSPQADRVDEPDSASDGTAEPGRRDAEGEAGADDEAEPEVGAGADGETKPEVGADADGETKPEVGAGTDDETNAGDETDAEPVSPDRFECTRDGCEATFDTEHGMRIHRSKSHGPAGPDYDAEDLRTVYERHDSFEAMRDALDADVSAQTVRRWMMDRGIHTTGGSGGGSEESDAASAEAGQTGESQREDESDPEPEPTDSDETRSEDDPEPEPTDSDAARSDAGTEQKSELDCGTEARYPDLDEELPDGVTAEALCAAVEAADTLYDVQKRLDVDRETARDVLSTFDLLELVHGRVADQDRREELKDEIDVRIEANASTVDSRSD